MNTYLNKMVTLWLTYTYYELAHNVFRIIK